MKQQHSKLFTGIFTFIILIILIPTTVFADTKTHVRILGATHTIFFGDVTISGCTVNDEANISHTYSDPLAVCALDAASRSGNFTYALKDFGGKLGLFIDQIAGDKSSSDFTSFWGYDINGQSAQQGISNQIIKDGDKLFFHFTSPTNNVTQRAVNDGAAYLTAQQNADGSIKGFSGVNSWASMAFSANDITNDTLLQYLASHPPASDSAVTDWEKNILAITSAGKNPFDFGGVNYEAKLETFHTNGQLGSNTQLNDDVFGLLALISCGPTASQSIKQDSLNFILSHQNTDGGFSWSTTGTSDSDDTAATIQALLAAQKNNMSANGLTDAINKAKIFLLGNQKNDGGFAYSSSDTSNTSTTAWAVMSLTALGMGNDDKFKNAITFIQNSQQENGSFAWQASSAGESFTTSYAITALKNKSWPLAIYSQNPSETPTSSPTPTINPPQTNSTTPVSRVPSISPTPLVTNIQSPTPYGNVLGNHSDRLTAFKNSKKKLQSTIREVKKRNYSFYQQLQDLFKKFDLEMQLLFFHK